jgi:hypothetical protein
MIISKEPTCYIYHYTGSHFAIEMGEGVPFLADNLRPLSYATWSQMQRSRSAHQDARPVSFSPVTF